MYLEGGTIHLMPKTAAPALIALLEKFIDYAGVFPPAALSLATAVKNYESYRSGENAWMLRYFVVSEKDLEQVPESLTGSLSVLASADHKRAAAIETASAPIKAGHPVYCEIAISDLGQLDRIKQAGCFAKVRTGGLKAELIPQASELAAFINACAEKKLPFKATAGLHHPIRADYALTYEKDSPKACMHGFLNVLIAAAFAFKGEQDIEPILVETDPEAFSFSDKVGFRGSFIEFSEIFACRQNFMHSVGSCSFEEPLNELKALNLL